MKKVIITLSLAGLMMCSCGNKTPTPSEYIENDSSVETNTNPTLFGLCGDNAGVDSLQLIVDNGDTLMLNVKGAIENKRLFGGYAVGCKMAVTVDDSLKNALLTVNEDVLMGNWVMLNPLDGSSYVGIRMKEGGVAESIDQSTVDYKTWRIVDGKLEITLVREGGGDMEETNLYDFVKLDADSLVYQDADDRMEYVREGKQKTDF